MNNQVIERVANVEDLKTYDVTFKDGSTDSRERLQIMTEVDVFDDLLDEYMEEDMFFTFWGPQAVKAAKTLKEGDYLYIKDFREKELPPNENYDEGIVARNIKQFKVISSEKAAKLKEKLKQLSEGLASTGDSVTNY